MKPLTSQPCEACHADAWEVVLTNSGPSVCSGRELIECDRPLVKAMCTRCGLVYTAQSPLDGGVETYYRQLYSSKLQDATYDYVNFERGKRFSQAVSDFVLDRSLSQRGRLLDIGCGKGLFVQALARAYPDWSTEGVDPSPRSIALARENAPGATFHERGFDVADFAAGTYDLIALHGILNRLAPGKLLREATSLLRAGGLVSVSVAILSEAPFQLYFADDYYLFFREHVLAMAATAGLTLVDQDEAGSIWRYLFRGSDVPIDGPQASLLRAAPALQATVRQQVADWQALIARLRALRDAGERVAFYGAGTTLMILLSQTEFPQGQVAGIYDDNPCKHGEEWWGVSVSPPPAQPRADTAVLCAGPGGVRVMRQRLSLPRNVLCLGAGRSASGVVELSHAT